VATGAKRAGVTPARACAFAVVRRVFERGAYADRALQAEARGLDQRERAFATQLAYGTVQRRMTIDYVAARVSSRPLETLDPAVLAAIRLGILQLLLLDGVAEHAAVNESVELAAGGGRGAAGFVNAVLRGAARQGRALLAGLDDDGPEGAAILHSVPAWLAERWWRELGAGEARALLRCVNQPAEAALRANELVARPEQVAARLPVPSHPAPELPEGLVPEGPFDAHGSELFAEGAIMPQARGSMLVARAVDPRPGERILDLCAAPGAKATHLAALLGNRGEIVAVERHRGRAEALRRTCERMHARCVQVVVGDAAAYRAELTHDRVLLDPPCSGLGTLQSRPDLRWRVSPESISEMAALQRRMLGAAGAATSPGGRLVYSVCTISRAESDEVVEEFVGENPDFELEGRRQLLPHRDRTDGFFIARLRRAG
jgi:16S rRNA (cytosine967-C5)-methyltransferase